jgi:hypothetical protein
MSSTKSSRLRQIEEESGVRATNFSIGLDHENDTTNQDGNEEDARNAEHEGDENEKDEGNDEQALVGALSASQVRRGRGPNKLPSMHFVITEVNDVRDPTQPSVSVNAWKTSTGKLVRKNVLVMYIF